MAAVISNQTTVAGLFKKKYASLEKILPKGYTFIEQIAPFETALKNGASIDYAIELSHENGVTLGGSAGDLITFSDAQSGVVKQASISPCEMFLSTAIPTGVLSRAANEGEQAFEKASKGRVKSNLNSHMRFLEQQCLYGQDTSGLGRVGYFTATWQAVSFTNGTGTLGGVAFTTGVNTAAKKILINPADWATGIWMGSEGMEVRQRIIGGAVADSGNATGKVVSLDLKNAIVEVDFTPVVATAASSHCIELLGQNGASGTDFMGAKSILTKSGSLFGISNTTYNMWAGSTYALGSVKLTFARLVDILIEACNKGLDKDVDVLVSFESWADLMTEQAALRKYDSSYKADEAVTGTKGIKFNNVNGDVTIRPHRFIRRGDAFVFAKGDWKRLGSTDLTMKVPGLEDGELVQKPVTTNVFTFRSYSDEALFCLRPAHSIYISGIDPSSAS